MSDISTAADTHCNSTDERLDSVTWLSVERQYESNDNRTSPPKSPLEEAIDDDEVRNGGVKKELSTSEYISPLMAPPIHTNDTLQPNNAVLVSMSSNHSLAETSMIYEYSQDNQNNTLPITVSTNNNKQSLIQKYRTFLQQNQLSIDLLENVMERFVFYGYLFKEHDHNGGISTELYYAIWNIIRWLNDVVLSGWGEGMGVTVGKRDEWLSNNNGGASLSEEKNGVLLSDSILLRLNTAVPILRAILTATTCIYPAMEAWSRRSTIHSSRSLLNNGDNNSIRQSRAAQVSYKLERIKFVARLALLSISWWAQQQRRRQQEDDNDQQRERIPTLLRRGGELDPYEKLVPLQDAEDEAKVVQYVGRRTGRRSIAARPSSLVPSAPSSSQLSSIVSSSIISNVTTLIKRLVKLLSSKHRILYVYAVGELLHILRPLYWSHAETHQYQKQRRMSSIPQKQLNLNSSYSFGIWKAYFVSLMMDLISDKLLQLSDGEDTTSTKSSSETHRRGSLFGSRGSIGGRQSSSAASSSAEQAKQNELDWRRSRHSLYLLRSPMYNTVTQPVATLLGRVVSMIPSFGLGQWAVEYVLDMMSYWNENHFMLES